MRNGMDSVDQRGRVEDDQIESERPGSRLSSPAVGAPSNGVYARVGDEILLAARAGVARGLNTQEICRELATQYSVYLSGGEVRLLLASRLIGG